jgi:tetratricopeptide (TPR) repeat protein
MRSKDRRAQKERLLCLAYAKMHGQPVAIDYGRYVADVSAYLAVDSPDAAHLWDRVGHWAQVDGEWTLAELQYRKAFSLEPGRYGYCLGTALNILKRFAEALPILLDQAATHQPDAMSWFQVAIAQEGVGDIQRCKEAYQRAISLDPEYDVAMFNLGGIYWNHGPRPEAIRIWRNALTRFPSHALSEKLRRDFPEFFSEND